MEYLRFANGSRIAWGYDPGTNERTVLALVKPRSEGLSLIALHEIEKNFYEGQSRTLRELVAKYGKPKPPRKCAEVRAEWRGKGWATKVGLSWGLPLRPVSVRQLLRHLDLDDFRYAGAGRLRLQK